MRHVLAVSDNSSRHDILPFLNYSSTITTLLSDSRPRESIGVNIRWASTDMTQAKIYLILVHLNEDILTHSPKFARGIS
ncbi:hypothetical protein MFRU_008g03000 [Monilinia fructicola]|nr:hypothetical protein MFRU_008g03000 [Monilinia fructicola]